LSQAFACSPLAAGMRCLGVRRQPLALSLAVALGAALCWCWQLPQVLCLAKGRLCTGGVGGPPTRTGLLTAGHAAPGIGVLPQQLREKADGFTWSKNWYPVAVAADLDAQAPHSVTLLGEALVLWNDGDRWACMADRCPHRLAPLSEGRLETSGEGPARLQCAYHGWEFRRSGACERIPQATSGAMEAQAGNRRACVKAYPTAEAAGLLWVWPDDGPDAANAAAATPLPLPEALRMHLREGSIPRGFFMRDLPYGHDILLENLVDPSHLPFSHHGVGNLRREGVTAGHRMESLDLRSLPERIEEAMANASAAPMSESTLRRVLTDAPTAAAFTKAPFGPPDNMAGVVHFTAPGRVLYEYPGGFGVVLFATPTAPGISRVFLVNLPSAPKKAPPFMTAMKMRILRSLFMRTYLGKYRFHMMDHSIFDGDGIFLTAQQHKLHREDAGGAPRGGSLRSYYMPTPADALVASMRRWYEGPGGGQPPWRGAHLQPAPLGPGAQDRARLLDRWSQHTRGCRVCLAAHRRLRRTSQATVAAACGTAAWWCGAVGAGAVAPLSAASVAALAAAGAGGLLYRWLRREIQTFHFVDYVHAFK